MFFVISILYFLLGLCTILQYSVCSIHVILICQILYLLKNICVLLSYERLINLSKFDHS